MNGLRNIHKRCLELLPRLRTVVDSLPGEVVRHDALLLKTSLPVSQTTIGFLPVDIGRVRFRRSQGSELSHPPRVPPSAPTRTHLPARTMNANVTSRADFAILCFCSALDWGIDLRPVRLSVTTSSTCRLPFCRVPLATPWVPRSTRLPPHSTTRCLRYSNRLPVCP